MGDCRPTPRMFKVEGLRSLEEGQAHLEERVKSRDTLTTTLGPGAAFPPGKYQKVDKRFSAMDLAVRYAPSLGAHPGRGQLSGRVSELMSGASFPVRALQVTMGEGVHGGSLR